MGIARSSPRVMTEELESRTYCAAVPSGPDLAAASVRPVFGSYLGGDTARTSVRALNVEAANAAAPGSDMVLYLSTDGSVDGGDRPLARVPVRPLRPGRTTVVRFRRFTFPTDLPAGLYELLARVDDRDAVNEVSEDNNVSRQGTINLLAPQIDLVPVALSRVRVQPRYKQDGVWGSATVTVWNVGNATYSGTPVVRAYRTTDGKIPIYLGFEMVVRSTSPVTIRPGRSAKVIVGFESYTGGVEFVLVLTLDGQDDPTANQFVTGIVHYRRR